MLETLKIKNLAIIDQTEISFKGGLNILSGETGAGKSVVLEAISLLLGGRASPDLIRTGSDEAVIEGLFDLAKLPWMKERLEAQGFTSESGTGEFLIKRTVHRQGKHRIYINGSLGTVSVLKALTEDLIDLCGQHEHQSLLKASVQLDLLDRYGGLMEKRAAYSAVFSHYRALLEKKANLERAEQERVSREEFLKFQIEELEAAELKPGEDTELQAEKLLLQSAEGRLSLVAQAVTGLDGDESASDETPGVLRGLESVVQRLKHLESQDPSLKPILDGVVRAQVELDEATLSLHRYRKGVELDPERLQWVLSRLSQLADFRRKYGGTIDLMLTELDAKRRELGELSALDQELGRMDAELTLLAKDLVTKARALSQGRKKAAGLFSRTVTDELKDLNMADAKFEISVDAKDDFEVSDLAATGADHIQFLVRTNRGDTERPLGKIASGGELSRLMLAIRRVISDQGGIGVYLFDEIDAGIGGQTAFQVGRKLASVSKHNQVICITHLPQVASFADHHLTVRKRAEGKTTITEVFELKGKTRHEELARMLGGDTLTPKSLENARELLDRARPKLAVAG